MDLKTQDSAWIVLPPSTFLFNKTKKPLPTWQKYILQDWLKNKYFKMSATLALWLHAHGLFTIWKIHYFVILSSFFSSPWNVFAPSSTSTFRHPDRANTLQTWPGRLKLLKTCHTNGKTKSKIKNKDSQAKTREIIREVVQYKPIGCIWRRRIPAFSWLHSAVNNTVVHVLLLFYLFV